MKLAVKIQLVIREKETAEKYSDNYKNVHWLLLSEP